MFFFDRATASTVVKDDVIGAGVWESILRPVKSDTVLPKTCHRCDVSSEPYCPGAKALCYFFQICEVIDTSLCEFRSNKKYHAHRFYWLIFRLHLAISLLMKIRR